MHREEIEGIDKRSKTTENSIKKVILCEREKVS